MIWQISAFDPKRTFRSHFITNGSPATEAELFQNPLTDVPSQNSAAVPQSDLRLEVLPGARANSGTKNGIVPMREAWAMQLGSKTLALASNVSLQLFSIVG